MLKSFFKERDCCTMIRPFTKEENLQNLEKMQLEELRPEFVEQVMTLRKKVINRIRGKTLNGKKLNGVMLYNLVLAYVDAINKGAVPNIESAWSYICKNECLKA
jgi:Guanylate-binding protein, C-terminal domain/Guanylate-binding protein, N-terminal domain